MTRRAIVTVGLVLVVGTLSLGSSGDVRAAKPGVPEGGYPSHGERVVLYLTNRARAEPSAYEDVQTYEPTPPIRWDLALSKAARWEARHVVEADCWCKDHSSCCRLERTASGVQCVDEPASCGATGSDERVALWSSNYNGENAARGYGSPAEAFDGWVHSSGHWRNINEPSHTLLGPGRYEDVWVQDFGRDGSSPPVASDGIHFEPLGSDETTFGLTYYQPRTGGPQSILLVLDGECHELELARGRPEHGAFELARDLQSGCHRYYFHVTDGRGNHHTYPVRGSLGISGGGGDDCPLYRRNRPADDCSPSGQSCKTGDTRSCYTGPYGTEGVGICEAGSERCIGGDWQGTCRYQTRPAPRERCGNDRDDDCDGEVDERCRNRNDADASPSASDTALHPADVGPSIDEEEDDDEAGGCSQPGHDPGGFVPRWWLGLLALAAWRQYRDERRVSLD